VGEAGVAERRSEDRVGAVVLMVAYALNFLNAFRECYEIARRRKGDKWEAIWCNTRDWSQMMIYDDDSVIRNVAPRLHLKCLRGEPFRLDAVFEKDEAWAPPHIAIEHENNPHGFRTELRALLSIGCPLKVGITYTFTSDIGSNGSQSNLRGKIACDICDAHAAFSALSKEDPDTECLFLIGSEEKPRELQWFSHSFRSGAGPTGLAMFA
jgi:hypothetical protein